MLCSELHRRLIRHEGLFLHPFSAYSLGPVSDPVNGLAGATPLTQGCCCARFDGQMTQLGKDWRHSGICISEKDTATNTNEDPPESLQHGLSFEVVVKLLRSVPALAIAFHSEPPSLTLDDKVNAVRTDRPLRVHSIAGGVKPAMDELLEHRFCSPTLFLDRSH